MKIVKFDTKNYTQEEINSISNYFVEGKVLAYPTDTIYGLGCSIDNKKGVEKIGKIKKRPKEKAYIVLVKSYCMLYDYFNVSKKQEEYIRKKWVPNTRLGFEKKLKKNKKAYTFILKPKANFPKYLLSDKEGVAVRLPKVEFLIKIIKKVDKPIISTSLNISGKSPLSNLFDIESYFEKLPDVVIDADVMKSEPSSIYDLRDMSNIIKIR